MEPKVYELVILGSGPAGLTAAIYAARANLNPLVIEGREPGGQLMGTSIVENWPGITSILGPDLMKKIRHHTEKNGVTFEEGLVEKVDFSKKPFVIYTKNKAIHAQSIIIATGTLPNKLGCPGEDTYWGKGVTTCAVCDATLYSGRKAIVVGGGDTAMESASFLRKFTKDVTVVHILDKLTASYAMQQRVLRDSNIKIIYESTITNIKGNGNIVTSATITNQKTKEETTLETDGIFIAIGFKPNSTPFKDYLELTKDGYIAVTNNTHTSMDGIFAAGDIMDPHYRQAIVAAGFGCMAALNAEEYLKKG